jgi:hypothetical protein
MVAVIKWCLNFGHGILIKEGLALLKNNKNYFRRTVVGRVWLFQLLIKWNLRFLEVPTPR